MGMWADEGALRTLYGMGYALGGSPTVYGGDLVGMGLVLFQSTFTESRARTLAEMLSIQADYVGYAFVDTNGKFPYPPAIVAGEPRLVGMPVTFTKTIGNPDQTIYGWGILGYSAGPTPAVLLTAKLFSSARILTDASNTISFVPYLGAYGV